ncbi:hypothetical protein J5277_11960 [Rhizobium sp. 16-449-1b]|uniref:hypothetical protein n=1 Tax=Rhizobium sp. 16-449-1b TaxID=2819989 RepID=UPI001ADA5703|nr:hypothetical protein [Rhizobium sp. 16-449-1b]MBO9194823.1 hypothetical protein [Rhizobium sp. 16-449-1b]
MNFSNVLKTLKENPGYATMRGIARFPLVRSVVTSTRGALSYRAFQRFLKECEDAMANSVFKDVDRPKFIKDLERDGVAFGLVLPQSVVSEIREFADNSPAYADRDPKKGFYYHDRGSAEAAIGKPILVAQYFNGLTCRAIRDLISDPFLRWVAAVYLRSVPTFVGCNLWWTSPVHASDEDRNKHAHLYHRDVDDYRFFKFFFYITDVKDGEGAHICVRGSIANPPKIKPGDRWNIRRYTDQEITNYYPEQDILEITGKAGVGFAEDTLCIHKGSTPKTEPRLLLQVQFALFNYGIMEDGHDPSALSMM